MKLAIQKDRLRCPDCDARAMVYPIREHPWEFAQRCPRGHTRWISWAHANPPPIYEKSEDQPTLFEAGDDVL